MSRDMQLRIITFLSLMFMIFIAPKSPVPLQAALFVLTYGVGDLASTKWFLSRGEEEGNPLARYFLKRWGFSSLIIIKIGTIIYFLIFAPVIVLELLAIVGIKVTYDNYRVTQDSGYTSLKV